LCADAAWFIYDGDGESTIMKKLLASMRRMTIATSQPCAPSAGQRQLFKFLLLIALSFCSYLFFSRIVVTAVEVKGASMSPTLTAGDRFLLNRFAYLHREPQRGELVVLKDPETGELIVKRIVGLPCETVLMHNETPYVNGRRLYEPYAPGSLRTDHFPWGRATVVPRGHYFVLGDNRSHSMDSRFFGAVPRENILGVIDL
jgi:signal peptidase I